MRACGKPNLKYQLGIFMIIDKIHEWLNGTQNFIYGRVLYNQLGDDEKLKALLKKGESNTTKDLLKRALQAIVEKPVIIPEKKINRITDEMPAHADNVLNGLRSEWKPFFSNMKYRIAKLDQFGESNTPEAIELRKKDAFAVLDFEKKCMFIWAKRDHYLKHGSLPVVTTKEAQLPSDPLALAKLIDNIAKNIRKNRSKMNKPGANAKYAELYQKYLALYKSVTGRDYEEKILNKPTHEQTT
jgi:hypothetical protein